MADDGLLVASLVAQLKLDIADFEAKAGQVEKSLSPLQRVLDSVGKGASSLTSGLGGTVGRMVDLISVVAGVQLGLAGLERLLAAGREAIIGYNSTLEQAQLSFTYLTGSADTAREHIQWLLDQANESPFPHEQWLAASRSLQTLGVNLTYVPGLLDKIADAAAGLTIPFDTATAAIGRFITLTAGGQGGGYATRQLMSLGLITGPLRNELTQMEAAGAAPQAVIDRFLDSLQRFKGASLEAANTWTGLMSRIKSSVEETAGVAFRPLFEVLKDLAAQFKAAINTDDFRLGMQRFAMFVLDSVQSIGAGVLQLSETFSGIWTRWGTQFENAMTAWNNLPAWFKDVGLLGVMLGGVKGVVAIGAMMALWQAARNSVEAVQRGMPLREWATANAQETRKWLEEHGGVPGEGPGAMVDTSLGMSAGMVAGTSALDRWNDTFARAKRSLQQQIDQGPLKTPAPPPERGGMTGPPLPATVEQNLKLEEARRAFLELNPLLSESEKQSSALALRFEQLEKDAGPVAGAIRQLGAAAQLMIREWADAAANKQLQDLPFKEGSTDVQQWEEAVGIATERVNKLTAELGPNADRVKEWRDYLYAAKDQLQLVRRAQDDVTEAMARNAAASRDYNLIQEALFEDLRKIEELDRQMAVQREAQTAATSTFRTAGLQGLNASAEQQSVVQGQIQQWQTVLTQLRQKQADVGDRESPMWKALGDDIDLVRGKIAGLTTELAGLNRLNELKGMVSDIFGAFNRAISTSITGIIQGTTTAKDAFANMGQSILLSIEEILIKRAFKQLEDSFNAMLDGMMKSAQESGLWEFLLGLVGAGTRALGGISGGLPAVGTAVGGAGAGGGYSPTWAAGAGATGAIVRRPTGALIGEEGPEAVIPLDQMPGASPLPSMRGPELDTARLLDTLATAMDRVGGTEITIIDQRGSGDIQRSETTENGRRRVELIIRDTVRSQLAGGEFDRLFASVYGVGRVGQSR